MTASYRFVVSGHVQGVFFRQSARERAQALGLQGWIRNRSDGCVEGVAAGTPSALEALRSWLRQGPPAARVDALEWEPAAEPVATAGFEVLR